MRGPDAAIFQLVLGEDPTDETTTRELVVLVGDHLYFFRSGVGVVGNWQVLSIGHSVLLCMMTALMLIRYLARY
jgi:hypothetical protein